MKILYAFILVSFVILTSSQSTVDYCALYTPTTLNVAAGSSTGLVYGRVYASGVTETSGANSLVKAQLGYGAQGSDPRTSTGWTWVNATWDNQIANQDEYQASLTVNNPGSYAYTYRASVDSGASYTYCDTDGAGTSAGLTFDTGKLGSLQVTP